MRIIPATVICLLPWYMYLYKGKQISILRSLLDVTSLSYWIDGNNRGWYIALTILLYLIYPIIFLAINKKEKRFFLTLFSLLFISIGINLVVFLCMPEWYWKVELALARIPIFLMGCCLAPFVKEKKEVGIGILYISLFTCVITVTIIELFRGQLGVFSIWRYLYALLGLCITLLFSWLFHIIHGSRVHSLLCSLGKYTLEIYLIHTQVLTVFLDQMKSIFKSTFSLNLFAVIISILLAIGVHVLVEKLFALKLFKNKENAIC